VILLPDMTEDERDEHALDFAYGNLACSTNHKPARDAFAQLAREKFGWTQERFDAWASEREWTR